MKKHILTTITAAALFAFISCNDFLNEDPKTALKAEQVYSDIKRVEPLVGGLYSKWRVQRKDRPYLTTFMGSDETEESEAQMVWEVKQSSLDNYSNLLDAQVPLINSFWNNYWPVTNAAAEIVANIKYLPDSERKNELKAEAHFVRAANYFELVQYWGAVPMRDYEKELELGLGRQPIKLIWEYIFSDLEYASKYLPEITTDYSRPRRAAAIALLGKAYMHTPAETGLRDFKKAAEQFEKIFAMPQYGLVDNYADLYDYTKPNSKESLYEFQFSNNYPNQNQLQYHLGSRACGHTKAYWGGYEIVLPTNYCNTQLWEVGDTRYYTAIRPSITHDEAGNPVNWVLYSEELGAHIKKYEDTRTSNNTWYSGKNVFYMRLADVYLCYAECLNEQNKTPDAVTWVNKVRTRAWGGTLPADKTWSSLMSQTDFRVKILDERMRELCFEGWRRLDLIRTGKLVELVKERNQWAKKSNTIKDYHSLYPIPFAEIDYNTDMGENDQNHGYSN